MKPSPTRRIVVTGGPGAGKTSLIDGLERRGLPRAFEAGRAIIQDQVQTGGTALPWADRKAYARLMLSLDSRVHDHAALLAGPVFFDRGVPDIVGYLRLCGLSIPEDLAAAALTLRYDPLVFIAPPWPEIFTNDAERKQDFAEAVRTHAVMAQVYAELGYTLVDLPRARVEDRVDFVLERIFGLS
ncbi:ATPase [Caulobacter sp. Root655]|uniref:AAA family ATPase n=1 Tax=Caulobacter sp. Root655 TaxID=1736578 RepID=UPI0007022BB3|nr:AAA family ATPase [Caulobacter sp. Root655]KRA56264.1 ATPase [Caulobacter sp. Root655]